MAKGHKTGGRQKGTPNKRTQELQAMASGQLVRSSEGGPAIAPLDVLLQTMGALWDEAKKFDAADPDGKRYRFDYMRQACQVAEKCAPYQHSKMPQLTELSGKGGNPLEIEITDASPREWARAICEYLAEAQESQDAHGDTVSEASKGNDHAEI